MKDLTGYKKKKLKNALVVIMAVIIALESIALIGFALKNDKSVPNDEQISTTTANSNTTDNNQNTQNNQNNQQTKSSVNITDSALNYLKEQGFSKESILKTVEDLIYSDKIINTIMAMAYPMLFKALNDLDMMQFAENIQLYPTGNQLASQISNSQYTCFDKDGTRKPLCDVLNNVGADWGYMDTEVTWTNAMGESQTTSIWNSIDWCVSDKDSFYKAIGDMSAGLRGILEVCLQSKTQVVNINVVDFVLKTDALPIHMDVAEIYNNSEKTGYETCFIGIFNTLGLIEGEYPSNEEFCQLTNLSDMWKAVFESLLFAVEKIADNPVDSIANLLVNLVNHIESGNLYNTLINLKMDGKYNKIAQIAMKLEDGEVYNLGKTLAGVLKDAGIDISLGINNILDELFKKITKLPDADLPDLDVNQLLSCATPSTLSNGFVYYTADSQKTIDFLVDYIVNEKIIESVINLTEFKGTDEAATIISSIGTGKDSIASIFKAVISILLNKISL